MGIPKSFKSEFPGWSGRVKTSRILLFLRVFAVELAESIKFEYFKTGLWKPWHYTCSDCLVFLGVCHSLLWEGWGCPFASLQIGNANGWFCQCRPHDGVVMPKIYRGHTVYYNVKGSPGQGYWLIVTCNLVGSWEVRPSSGAFSHPCSGSGKSEQNWAEPPSSSQTLAALGLYCEVLVSAILTVLYEKIHITCLFDKRWAPNTF